MGASTSNTRNRVDVGVQRTTVKKTVITEWVSTDDGKPTNLVNHNIKVIIAGAPRVGKTSITKRWLHNCFDKELSSYIPTSKVDIGAKMVQYNDSLLSIEIWDLPSHPEIRNPNLDLYFRDADVVVLVGDVTKPASFKDLEDVVVPRLKKHCNRHYNGMLPVMMVLANKHDVQLDSGSIMLTEELCNVMTDSYGANFGYLCSARSDLTIDTAMEAAIQLARNYHRPAWRPVSEEFLAHERAEEEAEARRKADEAIILAREQEEEEKEMRRIEKDLLREQGYEVSDSEEEDVGVSDTLISVASPLPLPTSMDVYNESALSGEGGAQGNALVEDGENSDDDVSNNNTAQALEIKITPHKESHDDGFDEEEEEDEEPQTRGVVLTSIPSAVQTIKAVNTADNDDFDEEDEENEDAEEEKEDEKEETLEKKEVVNEDDNDDEFDDDDDNDEAAVVPPVQEQQKDREQENDVEDVQEQDDVVADKVEEANDDFDEEQEQQEQVQQEEEQGQEEQQQEQEQGQEPEQEQDEDEQQQQEVQEQQEEEPQQEEQMDTVAVDEEKLEQPVDNEEKDAGNTVVEQPEDVNAGNDDEFD